VIRRAGSAALDLFGFGGGGLVVAYLHRQPGEAEQHRRQQNDGQIDAPEEVGLLRLISHGSPHQIERFVNRNVRR